MASDGGADEFTDDVDESISQDDGAVVSEEEKQVEEEDDEYDPDDNRKEKKGKKRKTQSDAEKESRLDSRKASIIQNCDDIPREMIKPPNSGESEEGTRKDEPNMAEEIADSLINFAINPLDRFTYFNIFQQIVIRVLRHHAIVFEAEIPDIPQTDMSFISGYSQINMVPVFVTFVMSPSSKSVFSMMSDGIGPPVYANFSASFDDLLAFKNHSQASIARRNNMVIQLQDTIRSFVRNKAFQPSTRPSTPINVPNPDEIPYHPNWLRHIRNLPLVPVGGVVLPQPAAGQ